MLLSEFDCFSFESASESLGTDDIYIAHKPSISAQEDLTMCCGLRRRVYLSRYFWTDFVICEEVWCVTNL